MTIKRCVLILCQKKMLNYKEIISRESEVYLADCYE